MKSLLKNLLAFLTGNILAMIATVIYLVNPLSKVFNDKHSSLAGIALIPVAIIYILISGILGGAIGVIVYNLSRIHKKAN
jgi:hypothetical protein